MSQGHLIFTPCVFFELPTWKSEEKKNILCGGSPKQAGHRELPITFIEAENTVG